MLRDDQVLAWLLAETLKIDASLLDWIRPQPWPEADDDVLRSLGIKPEPIERVLVPK